MKKGTTWPRKWFCGPGDYYGEQIAMGLLSIAACGAIGYAVAGEGEAVVGIVVGAACLDSAWRPPSIDEEGLGQGWGLLCFQRSGMEN
jgi:hypothetical protein